MSWAVSDQDEHGFQLLFFQVYRFCLGTLAKTLVMVYNFLFKNSLHIFLLVFFKYFVYDKGT